jgi:hypothetical protein
VGFDPRKQIQSLSESFIMMASYYTTGLCMWMMKFRHQQAASTTTKSAHLDLMAEQQYNSFKAQGTSNKRRLNHPSSPMNKQKKDGREDGKETLGCQAYRKQQYELSSHIAAGAYKRRPSSIRQAATARRQANSHTGLLFDECLRTHSPATQRSNSLPLANSS